MNALYFEFLYSLFQRYIIAYLFLTGCFPDACVHGQCIEMETGYNCTCDAGYSGSNCSTGTLLRL